MRKCNIIAVFDPATCKVLMCRRRKEPYTGLLNFVGGKVREGECSEDAAYRELQEETSLTRNDIKLTHLMDFSYFSEDLQLEVYAGRMRQDKAVYGEENELCWCSTDANFSDAAQFAGHGNIEHIMQYIAQKKDLLLRG